ncbi:MAG TPA: NAD(P)/FAD-dependent oxidoreductase [Acidimicrobiales bacterium]|jgi:cyclohexanone monooxygenase|nr:NAD(P)/FAD-dependent oxidoreductase [Acidimicrobiales bacterium]
MSVDERRDVALKSDFDPGALRERYRLERDKRLRPEGNAQYIEAAGNFAGYLRDPYVERTARPALDDDVTVAIIGGGFAGLITGARLRQAGIDDVRIIEKGGDFGGTWYWNRYPGAQCDVESYVYLPLLEETSYVPSEKYAHAPEILEHCHRIATHFDLYERACLSTEVTGIQWDADRQRWTIRTDRGDNMRARFVVMGNGPLHRPKLPGIPGIETFGGHTFHTSRWDYGFTGGDSNGHLTGLRDKRVAIIGTGATAVQVVPHVAAAAAQLYVLQRTPSSIDVRANRPTDPSWAAGLSPGWQKERIENFTLLTSGGIAERDLVMDGWTDIIGRLLTRLRERDSAEAASGDLASVLELADFEKMEQIRARVDSVVRNTSTAEALKPWYRQFCKRPCFHDDYLQAFNRESVELIDTDGRGVDRVTANGVVAAGREYEVDCIIFATGFEVGTDYTRRAGYDVVGSKGTLSEYWKDGMRSVHGMHVHGFPNMFVVGHTQGGFTVNYPHLLDEASRHACHVVRHAIDHEFVVEATAAGEEDWLRTLEESARDFRAFQEQCTPGYYNNEGQPGVGGFLGSSYGNGPMAFFNLLADWRDDGTFAGLDLTS